MCPPGTDQTGRSPEIWHILAPRTKKSYWLQKQSLQEMIFNESCSWNSWSLLAATSPPLSPAQPIVRQRAGSVLSRLESMPPEIIAMVIEDPGLEKIDVISLGLASQTLWLHLLEHVATECRTTTAPFAGVEIACTGTHLTTLPESFIKDGLAMSTVRPLSPDYRMCEARQFNWGAVGSYNAVFGDAKTAWEAVFEEYVFRATGISKDITAQMTTQLSISAGQPVGESIDAAWVLRNLTTKKYVRCRPGTTSREKRGYVGHPDVANLRVDDVLLMRICWGGLGYSPSLSLKQGQWAGHCFDIVPMRQELLMSGTWEDVTDDVVRQALDIAGELWPQRTGALARRPNQGVSDVKMKRKLDRKNGLRPVKRAKRPVSEKGLNRYVDVGLRAR